jgi:GAF domain-containing protein
LETGQPVIQPSTGASQPAVLVVPIKLRGETLGVIHLKDAMIPDRKWSEDEILAISAVADQVSLALENARLLEKTIRRAERDRKALEITGKIRATNDPRSMVEVALEELQQTLKASRVQIILKENGDGGPSDESRLLAVKLASQANPEG